MAVVKPAIMQIVGYQNSGKTTLILKLIEVCKRLGYKTVTIKHHGHGGKPDIAEQKDSTRHLEAGAEASIAEGDGCLILQAERKAFSLDEQIMLLSFFNPEVILIEGHKRENYPKLLLIRHREDLSLLHQVTNILAVIYWTEEVKECLTAMNLPLFAIDDAALAYKCAGLLSI